MKAPLHISFFAFILLILLAESNLRAQWKEVAPDLFTNNDPQHSTQGGAGSINYCDGIIWVGVRSLFSSQDSGKTWQKMPLPALESTFIRDIEFIDKWRGVVATSDEGVLLTDDGGQTWKTILSTDGDFWKASFNGSPEVIHALGINQGTCYTTMDGGLSWNQSYIGPYVSCLAIAPDRTIYVFAQQDHKKSTQGWISYSTDLGSTWVKSSGLADGDSYTLSVDSCDPNRLYLLNEDWASSNDNLSEVFITSDKGNSWESFDEQEVPYFTGPLATTTHSMYAGTVQDDGIVRSTDKGISWQSIGGPPTEGDSRTVEAINDNIIIVLDTKGNIWGTFNSGGDPLQVISPNPPLRFSSARIINDSFNIELHLPLYFHKAPTQWDADMIMHYRTFSLKFLGATLYNGKSFDVAGSDWPGRTALHFNASDLSGAPDSLLGYIDFLWTPLELDCNEIIFDSIKTVDPCTEPQTQPFHGIIGSYQTCEQLSATNQILHETGFSIAPNPAGDYAMISSQTFSGNIVVKLYDMTGKLISSMQGIIDLGAPMKIMLGSLGAGVYHLSITGNNIHDELTFVHQ